MTGACLHTRFQETVGMDHPGTDVRADRFIFFDMGNVLLNFDHQVAWQQMARLCEVDPDMVRKTVFEDPMQLRYERGELSSQEFYESFCQQLQVQPDYDLLMKAASDIFQPAHEVIQLVVGLQEDNDVGPFNSCMKVNDPLEPTAIDLEPIDVGVNV